jgi:DNA-binding winged helix-turn-helix (wHTH) protein/tetratricopeptide (TPR) repeat protein
VEDPVASSARPPGGAFGLGPWRVEPGLNRLLDDGREVALEPRAMDLLVCLARHAGETVPKETLLDEVWQGAFVTEGVIAKTVSSLRQALGDDAASPRFIRTVSRRGYRLITPVRELDVAAAAGAGEAAGPAPADLSAAQEERPPRGSTRRAWRRWAGVGSALSLLLLLSYLALRERASARPLAFQRLAVAPFDTVDSGEQGSRLAAALRPELVGELVRLESPRVFLLEKGPVEARGALATARSIGADSLLLGHVQKLADRVHVDLELLDTADGEMKWSTAAERPTRELYALRRELAGAVMERFGSSFEDRLVAAGGEPPIGPDAYRTFLEARFLWSRRGRGDLEKAHDLFAEITREAPGFAEGFAWLALSEVTRANYLSDQPPARILERGEAAARRALALDPGDPVAQVASGLVELNLHCRTGPAIEAYRRAIALAPSFAPAHQFLAEALAISGRYGEAVEEADAAVALEPFSPVVHGVRGLVLNAAGHPDEAIRALDRALVLDPRFTWLHRYRAFALARKGEDAQAADELVAELAAAGLGGDELSRLRADVARDGLPGFWRWRLEQLRDQRADGKLVRPTQMAEALAAAGRADEALAELARAPGFGDGEYFLHLRASPAFDGLRDDPRFRAIYARFGL